MRDLHFLLLLLFAIICACERPAEQPTETTSGAGEALDFFAMIRSYPDGRLRSDKIYEAFAGRRQSIRERNTEPEWEALGPKNIGGRTLCLAFHPSDPSILYAGAAGGGLWRSTSAGAGASAWTRIPTGFPALAIGAIAIDPVDPEVMYVGTGEVYNYTAAEPGTVNRLTRGLYGFGILKTIDGGETWTPVLDFSQSDLTGVWKIIVNPLRPATVYAATTEGLYRSYDGGAGWTLIHPLKMAMDMELNPVDTNILFVSHGGYLSPERGVYRSTDGGQSFALLTGLPADYQGKTMLDLSPSAPEVIYASVADPFESIGLFRSADSGATWTLVSDQDVAKWQGWYSHDVAVHPEDPNLILYGGIDIHRSANGGAGLQQITNWNSWYFGQVPVGGPEGPGHYVHADIHGLYFHPFLPDLVYAATDGGVFVSNDAGLTWEGRNGGYQTQQFYANFANSSTDPNLAIGGMQDNSTAIYTGDDAWTRVIGGDGMSAAIHYEDDGILFGSSQGLNLYRSENLGPFSYLNIFTADNEARCFNGPFELAPAFPDQMYAGAQRLHVSFDRGDTWEPAGTEMIDDGNPVLTIAVDPVNPYLVYVSTAPQFGPPGLFKSENGGADWTSISDGLPDRVVTDIAIDPLDPDLLVVSVSGFGAPHVFRSEDGGAGWTALGAEQLPDVPASTVLIDPLVPTHLFLGNDLGVYASLDGGATWELFSGNLPDAAYVMHLSVSADRQLRAATHGNGIWQAPLPEPPSPTNEPLPAGLGLGAIFPNPASAQATVTLELARPTALELWLTDGAGRRVRQLANGFFRPGRQPVEVDLQGLAAGYYHCVLLTGDGSKAESKPLIIK